MQLAQKRDSAAQIFDGPTKDNFRIPPNNFLFDSVHVGAEDLTEKNENNAIVQSRQSHLRGSVTDAMRSSTTMSPEKKSGAPSFIKNRLKMMQRIWSATTKFVASQCLNGRTVDLPLSGKFKQ